MLYKSTCSVYPPFIVSTISVKKTVMFSKLVCQKFKTTAEKMSSNPQCRLHMRLPLTSLSSCASWPSSLLSSSLPSSTFLTCSSGEKCSTVLLSVLKRKTAFRQLQLMFHSYSKYIYESLSAGPPVFFLVLPKGRGLQLEIHFRSSKGILDISRSHI